MRNKLNIAGVSLMAVFLTSCKSNDRSGFLILPGEKHKCLCQKRQPVTTIITFLLLLFSSSIQSQTIDPKLNQMELDMQFIGKWKAEAGRDTIIIIECKSACNGVETLYKTETRGKVLFEEKSLLGYDKKTGKLIECSVDNKSPDIGVYVAWFTSGNKMEEILLEDLPNADKASSKTSFEFISPDVFETTYTENNKVTEKHTFNREK